MTTTTAAPAARPALPDALIPRITDDGHIDLTAYDGTIVARLTATSACRLTTVLDACWQAVAAEARRARADVTPGPAQVPAQRRRHLTLVTTGGAR